MTDLSTGSREHSSSCLVLSAAQVGGDKAGEELKIRYRNLVEVLTMMIDQNYRNLYPEKRELNFLCCFHSRACFNLF